MTTDLNILKTAVGLKVFGLVIEAGVPPKEAINEIKSLEMSLRHSDHGFNLERFFPKSFALGVQHSAFDKIVAELVHDDFLENIERSPGQWPQLIALAKVGLYLWRRSAVEMEIASEHRSIFQGIADFVKCGLSLSGASEILLKLEPRSPEIKKLLKALSEQSQKLECNDSLLQEFFIAAILIGRVGGNCTDLAEFFASI